jgi:hypothetical protein
MSAPLPARHGETMRIFSPAPHVLAFYDGRVAGDTLPAESPTWLDWAYGLGTSSFAIVDGDEALAYRSCRWQRSLPGLRHYRPRVDGARPGGRSRR